MSRPLQCICAFRHEFGTCEAQRNASFSVRSPRNYVQWTVLISRLISLESHHPLIFFIFPQNIFAEKNQFPQADKFMPAASNRPRMTPLPFRSSHSASRRAQRYLGPSGLSKILIDFLVFISIFNNVKTCKVKASTLHKNY